MGEKEGRDMWEKEEGGERDGGERRERERMEEEIEGGRVRYYLSSLSTDLRAPYNPGVTKLLYTSNRADVDSTRLQ